jgi:hypothetical protein
MSQRTMMQRERERETALASVQEVLSSSGQPLDADTQNFMGARFGHDFGQVRVHTDEKAAESAQSVNALAYTVGQDVVFGQGQYTPGTSEGKKLLAHELTHVVQQGITSKSPPTEVGATNDSYEQEAATTADTVLRRSAFGFNNTESVLPSFRQQIGVPRIQRALPAIGVMEAVGTMLSTGSIAQSQVNSLQGGLSITSDKAERRGQPPQEGIANDYSAHIFCIIFDSLILPNI